ncbi:pseudouridine synthase [Rariglobus hedericola]|uniref:Pseudouridine synthase n=1 Tax=Rariglobus hedericola TaxID=2597822 RepID=A0A556QS15_9BACT|nr:pseudouridine synthase [Rariglobus hedericola]TSJ79437.1 rRNA pseudouridine synthase [Rariglobus hedericola]
MRRLDQLLANLGYCSRREARDWIKKNAVTVKGKAVRDPSDKAHAADVLINGEPLDHPEGILLVLNKPLGLVCSHDEREGPRVYDLLPERWRARNPQVTSIGRLDKDTSGLILLTDQTELVHKYTSPKHKVPKLYRATTDRDLTSDLIPLFAAGTLVLEGEDDPCAPAELRLFPDAPRTADLILTEGKYHQVRRMFAATGATVLTLHRVQFGNLTLGDLAPGEFRSVTVDEI